MTLDEIWKTVLGEIELQISRPNFLMWLKTSRLLSKDEREGAVTVGVPNNFTKEWVEQRYHKMILSSLRNLDSSIRNISYVIQSHELNLSSKKPKQEQVPETQTPLLDIKVDELTNLNPRYTLQSFIVGSSNELAYAAMTAVTQSVGKKYNPLFIYGGVGLGKTHLIQGAGNEIKNQYQNKIKVLYVPSEKFIHDVVQAIRNRRMEDVKSRYRNVDVLIVDDIQFIGGKEATELEFFHTFNILYEKSKQIIISSDRPPAAIPTLEERLKSRFEGGMIVDISYPDYETRLAILRAKVQEKGWHVEDKILEATAAKVQRNIRELEGVLNKIIFYQDVKKENVDLKRLDAITNEILKAVPKNINPNNILKAVADFFEVSPNDLISKTRKREVVEPRQIAMYLLRELLNLSYPYVGEKLGNRDHTTAIHACAKINKEINNNSSLNQKILMIKEIVYKM